MSQRWLGRRSCELAGRPGKVLRAAISIALLSAAPGVARAENWTQWTSLQCYYEVKDGYGRPVPGVSVGLEFWGDMCPNTPRMSGTTGADGKTTLYRSAGAYDCYGNQVVINSFRCVVYENETLTSNMTATSYSATTLSLTTFLAPNPQRQHFTSGFVNNGGPCTESNGDCASAELYLGADGMYDKVVVVPEPINTSYYRRSARQMWKEYNIDVCARTDVWTPTTGSQALWIEKKVDLLPDGLSRDWHIYYKRMEPNAFADDLESGSKHDISESPDIGGWRWGFHGSAEFHQYGPISTFIPLRSALDRTCDPGVTWCPQVLDAEWTNSYNAAHHRLEKPQIDWLVAQLDASHTCDQPAREYLALRSPRSFTLLTTVGRRHS